MLLLVLAGCERQNPEENAVSSPAPPPATALAPMRGTQELDNTLVVLERELDAALGMDLGQAELQLLRAEAITDRLLETRSPFDWLARAYSVDALLRQIQALADRVLAERRSGMRDDLVRRDLQDLRDKVRDLRASLRSGGGRMPLSLDSLLAAYPADSGMVGSDAGGE